MRLYTDSVNSDTLRLEPLHHSYYPINMGRTPDIEIIVIQFTVRSITICEDKSVTNDFVAITVKSFDPAFVAILSLFSNDFIHHIPSLNASIVPGSNRLYV